MYRSPTADGFQALSIRDNKSDTFSLASGETVYFIAWYDENAGSLDMCISRVS